MSATNHFHSEGPVSVGRESLLLLDEILQRFAVESRRAAVSAAGENPDAVTSAVEVRANAQQNKNWALLDLAREMERAEKVSWSIRQADGIRRSGFGAEEILKLPNSAGAAIRELEGSAGEYTPSLQITFDCQSRAAVTVAIRGEYAAVHTYGADIKNWLSANRPGWAFFTRPLIGHLIVIASLLLLWIVASYQAVALASARGWSEERISLLVSAIPVGVGALSIWPASVAARKWKAVFPLVEFVFGGGQQISETNKAWRDKLWTIPVLAIIIPLLLDWLSPW